jgi:hypothetical protein
MAFLEGGIKNFQIQFNMRKNYPAPNKLPVERQGIILLKMIIRKTYFIPISFQLKNSSGSKSSTSIGGGDSNTRFGSAPGKKSCKNFIDLTGVFARAKAMFNPVNSDLR